MGIIKVGGYGKANLKTLRDALDDATRACEAAYRDGYTIGSSVAIGSAILSKMDLLYGEDDGSLKRQIMGAIYISFREVFKQLWENKGSNPIIVQDDCTDGNWTFELPWNEDGTKAEVSPEDLYDTCALNNWVYDIVNCEFDKKGDIIINPVNVDIEVLQGCLRLVLNCFSSDQLIITNTDQLNEFIISNPTRKNGGGGKRIFTDPNPRKVNETTLPNPYLVTTEIH